METNNHKVSVKPSQVHVQDLVQSGKFKTYLGHAYSCDGYDFHHALTTDGFITQRAANQWFDTYGEPTSILEFGNYLRVRCEETGVVIVQKMYSVNDMLPALTTKRWKYFGLCLLRATGEIASISTVWVNQATLSVLSAEKDADEALKTILLRRRYFAENDCGILSTRTIKKGVDVRDPISGNVVCCNTFGLLSK